MPEERENILQDLGKKVRGRREQLGFSLRDVHDGTKIREQFLDGIERGDFSEFPGTVYVRGFIRKYLEYLGAGQLWEEYLPFLPEEDERVCSPDLVLGTCTPPARGFRPASRFWLFVVLLMAVAGSAWYVWFTWNQDGRPSFEMRDEIPARPDSASPGQQPAAQDGKGSEVSPASTLQAPPSPQAPTPAGVVPPPSAEELAGITPAAPAAPKQEKVRELLISAKGDCWIRVQQGGKTVFERTVKAGESVSFPVKVQTVVTYGRAGSVAVAWNGKPPTSPGVSGGVERFFYSPDGTSGRVKQ